MPNITPFLWFNDQADRVMKAMLQMTKLDINGLQQAYDQG